MTVENRTSQLAATALATLTKALESGDSQALTAYLSVMARFHTYSWNNSLLIAVQRPSATRVAGFRAWLRLGRHVRKGEKGIAILAPVVSRVKNVDGAEADEQLDAHAFRRLVGFRTAYVFDVAQTEGQKLPEFSSVKGEPEENTPALKAFIDSRSIALEYDQSISPAYGASHGGRISLLPGLSAAVEFQRWRMRSHMNCCTAVTADRKPRRRFEKPKPKPSRSSFVTRSVSIPIPRWRIT